MNETDKIIKLLNRIREENNKERFCLPALQIFADGSGTIKIDTFDEKPFFEWNDVESLRQFLDEMV